MKLEFNITYLDLLIYYTIQQLTSWVTQIFGLLFLGYMFILEMVSNESSSSPYFSAILTAVTWWLIIWICQILSNLLFLYSQNKKMPITKHIIEIRTNSLYTETKYSKSYFCWSSIYKLGLTPGFIYVYVLTKGAVIIPNRAFETLDAKTSFYHQLLLMTKNSS